MIVYNNKWVPRPSTFKVLSRRKLSIFILNGEYDIGLLRKHFLQMNVNKIIKIPRTNIHNSDVRVWLYDNSGYSCRSGYQCIVDYISQMAIVLRLESQ